MPHHCVRCNKIYDDADKAILEGCRSCGGTFFFYIKKERLAELKET
ncbi:Zn-ribbon domain-containing protein, partial [Candidatus Woesearchaeota archaeon]|nr:Zn-ribbon domain-containing protein [Candidatus Woesearchaeota archaeon]